MTTTIILLIIGHLTALSFGVFMGGIISIGGVTPSQLGDVPEVNNGWKFGLAMTILMSLLWVSIGIAAAPAP